MLKREFAHGATNTWQSRQTVRKLYDVKFQTNQSERQTIEETIPHRVIKNKKPMQIMEEAHAYNVQKMAEYRAKGNEEKYQDIQDLLRQMTDVMGKKKAPQ